jgi:hypothetical protein
MAISLVGSNTNSAAAADITIDLSGIAIQEGDVVYVATSGNGLDLDVTENSGTYTELGPDQFADDSSNLNFAVFRKVQGSTPDTSVTINNAGATACAGLVYVLRGVDNTTPEDAEPTVIASTAGTGTPNPSGIDTVTAGAWVLPFGGSSEADDVTDPPADYTDLVDVQGTAVNVMVSRREIAEPGFENPGSYGGISGSTADPFCAITVAVRPAPEPDAAVVQPLTYGAGRLSPERVRAKYREIEEIDRQFKAKEEAEREKVRKQEEAKRQLAELEDKKRQTKTIAERRRKLEARIAAYQSEITELRATMNALLEEIERARVEFELQQTIADRRRRMLLLIAAAA